MKVLALIFLLPLAQQQPPAVDPKDELAKAAQKSLELENYAFKGRIAVEGVPFLADPIDFRGRYVKDKGFTAEMGPFGTIFRLDKKVAVKDPDNGEWVLLAKGVNQVGEGALATYIALIGRGLRPPHEELKKFEGRFKEIRKREDKIGEIAAAVYEGPLTEAGIRAAFPAGLGLVIGKGRFEGTGKAWVVEGRVVRFDADARLEIEDGDKTSEVRFSRTTELVDFGKATVEMPGDVKMLFEK